MACDEEIGRSRVREIAPLQKWCLFLSNGGPPDPEPVGSEHTRARLASEHDRAIRFLPFSSSSAFAFLPLGCRNELN